LLDPDPGPGSRPWFTLFPNLLFMYCRSPRKTNVLQKKPPQSCIEHPSLPYLLDPDPQARLDPDPIRIRTLLDVYMDVPGTAAAVGRRIRLGVGRHF
jgi:hypothetical protein